MISSSISTHSLLNTPLSQFLWLCWHLAQKLVRPAEISPHMNVIKASSPVYVIICYLTQSLCFRAVGPVLLSCSAVLEFRKHIMLIEGGQNKWKLTAFFRFSPMQWLCVLACHTFTHWHQPVQMTWKELNNVWKNKDSAQRLVQMFVLNCSLFHCGLDRADWLGGSGAISSHCLAFKVGDVMIAANHNNKTFSQLFFIIWVTISIARCQSKALWSQTNYFKFI